MLESLFQTYYNLCRHMTRHGGWVENMRGSLILVTNKKVDAKRLRKISKRGKLNRQSKIERNLLRKYYKRRGK